MKKTYVLLFLVASLTTLTTSCQKEDQSDLSNFCSARQNTFQPPRAEDMDAYLKEFRLKMMDGKGTDVFSPEVAAWHLSSLGNQDFGHVNVDYDDIRFDTLYSHVEFTDGSVSLQSLNAAYRDIHGKIDSFFRGLPLEGKHIRFINAFIGEDGTVTIPVTTTFIKSSRQLGDTMWYFPNGSTFYLETLAFTYFGDTAYVWNTHAINRLKYLLNLLEGRPTEPGTGRVYYTVTRNESYHYNDYTDPFGSPYYNSRLYLDYGNFPNTIYDTNMLYLLDSYLGLGKDGEYLDEVAVTWDITGQLDPISGYPNYRQHHILNVAYGQHILNQGPNIE